MTELKRGIWQEEIIRKTLEMVDNGVFPRVEQVYVALAADFEVDIARIEEGYLSAIQAYGARGPKANGTRRDTKLAFGLMEIDHGGAGYGHRVWLPSSDNPAVHFVLKKFCMWKGPDKRRPNPHVNSIVDLSYELQTQELREALALIL